jgi:hypothetical protein
MRLELLDNAVFPSTFNEPPISMGLTSIAKSTVAAPEASSAKEDAENRSNMLTAEAVRAEVRGPGSVTNAFNEDAACVASVASVIAVLLPEFKNISAFSLTARSSSEFELVAAYSDNSDTATLETSRFCASASPAKPLDARSNTSFKSAADAALMDMSGEHMRTVAPRESMASIPRDFTPLATLMAENEGAADELST